MPAHVSSRKWTPRSLLALTLGLAIWPAAAVAQVTSAAILGTVHDETGAVLPGIVVTIKNVETGITRTVVTDDQGRYTARQLALGEYEVQGALPGFQTAVRRGIRLTLGREAVVDLSLRIGDFAEDVVVIGEAPLVESTNAMMAGLVEARQMQELPLNARSYIDLALLQPGTIGGPALTTFGYAGTYIAVAGARPTSTTFLLDGNITTSVRGTGPNSIAGTALGVDAIQEFEVISSPYSAEYGRGTGGTVNVVSKSGTNRFHGSIFEFHRNDQLDAANFFDALDPVSGEKIVPDLTRNQFGGSLGGRIVRDRTFFFGTYEALRQQLGVTEITRIPNLEARQGVVAGRPITVKPAVKPYLQLFPVPNGRDFGDGTAEYTEANVRTTNEDFVAIRVDHQFSAKHSAFARYTFSKAIDSRPASFHIFRLDDQSRSQFATVEHKSILSPNFLNVARVGFTRHNLTGEETPLIDLDPSLAIQPGTLMPSLPYGLGSADLPPRYFIDNTFEFYDSLNYTRGRHALKAGAQVQRVNNNVMNHTRQSSRWDFTTLEDFLQGNASRVQIAPRELADPIRNMRQTFVAGFLQDDLRFTPHLTLNLGLRAEWASSISEKDGKLARIPTALLETAKADDILTGDPWYNNPGVTFGPRVGLAWDPFRNGKTVFRTGAGIFYDHIWAWSMSGTGNFRMPPFYNTFDLRERFAFPTQASQFVALLRQRQVRDVPHGTQIYQVEENPARQRVWQFSFDVQQEIAGNAVLKVGYKGSRGAHLPRLVDVDTARPVGIVDGRPVFSPTPVPRNPAFGGTMLVIMTDAESFYNALLVELSKRFSRGLQFQLAYTFSKNIDDASGFQTGSVPGGGTSLSWEFPELDRGLSDYDVRHNIVTNMGIELPFGAGRAVDLSGLANTLFGGWAFNSIVTFASGRPVSISQGTTAATSILGGSRRPDLIPGGDNNPVLGGPDRYFDVSQFALADRLVYGNVARHTLIGPGYVNVDFSLVKNFEVPAVSEAFRVSARAEAFNLLNRANFGFPDTQVFDGQGRLRPSAGRITRTVASARQIQLSLRLSW